MAEDLVVGFTTTESLKRCFSQVKNSVGFSSFLFTNRKLSFGTVPQTLSTIQLVRSGGRLSRDVAW